MKYLLMILISLTLAACGKTSADAAQTPVVNTPEPSLTVAIPQSGGNTNAGNAVGFSTSAWKDGAITAAAVSAIGPKSMRWPEGMTGNKIHFNKNNPAKFDIGIHDPNADFLKFNFVARIPNTWTTQPEFNFDDFIAKAKAAGAEPVVVIGIQAIYAKTGTDNMTRAQVVQAAVDFVRYANVIKGYGVKYWEIGNEDDLEMQRAGINPSQWYQLYADILNEIAPLLKAVDPSLKIGANAMSYMDANCWNKLIPQIKNNAGFLVAHSYSGFKNTQYHQWYANETGRDWVSEVTKASAGIRNNPGSPLALFVTEISSYHVEEWGEANTNTTWKGLHNIQMNLDALAQPYTKAVMAWTSRWDDDASKAYNLFSPSYGITSMGWSLPVLSQHLYSKLGPKIVATSVPVTMWVSHNDANNKMSVFLLNRGSSAVENLAVTINGYAGSYANEKWVYSGSTPLSTDATFTKLVSQNVQGNTFKVNLPPLSVTVINFNAPG